MTEIRDFIEWCLGRGITHIRVGEIEVETLIATIPNPEPSSDFAFDHSKEPAPLDGRQMGLMFGSSS